MYVNIPEEERSSVPGVPFVFRPGEYRMGRVTFSLSETSPGVRSRRCFLSFLGSVLFGVFQGDPGLAAVPNARRTPSIFVFHYSGAHCQSLMTCVWCASNNKGITTFFFLTVFKLSGSTVVTSDYVPFFFYCSERWFALLYSAVK